MIGRLAYSIVYNYQQKVVVKNEWKIKFSSMGGGNNKAIVLILYRFL